jgi:hypothetical protein
LSVVVSVGCSCAVSAVGQDGRHEPIVDAQVSGHGRFSYT